MTYQSAAASFLRVLLHAVAPRMPICVCVTCVLPGDEVVGVGGDYSICDRCGADLTGEAGLSVRGPETDAERPS